ncbi:hypothetical protein [Paenibacillus silvae]|uniref:hypothetical protein n=2 Tax=Paenibacillus silvae TaxID=1325358 RepID=UPI0020057EEA|nr:hypothetical protein [Paenibacillus silvae]MCK6073666.1 hypothetical protein [Paenibacillus silvae]MCK6148858.1 hypothetical protein [Paenibacillus silvae]MCK6267158.1 hypothetical protein [Paenibacillus silvae]
MLWPELQVEAGFFVIFIAVCMGIKAAIYETTKLVRFVPLLEKLINGIKSLKLTLIPRCVRLKEEINMIILVGIKIEAVREVADGGTSSDK